MGNWDYWKKKDRSFYKDVFLKRANEDLPTMESQKATMKIMDEKFKIANPKKKYVHLLFKISHPSSLNGIDFPSNFFKTGSFVKYLPNINARPNKIFIIVGFMLINIGSSK